MSMLSLQTSDGQRVAEVPGPVPGPKPLDYVIFQESEAAPLRLFKSQVPAVFGNIFREETSVYCVGSPPVTP